MINGAFTQMLLARARGDPGDRGGRSTCAPSPFPTGSTSTVALLAPLYWLSVALPLWPDVGLQLAVGAAVFVFLAGAFYAGMMGGGDVKLAAALALWFSPRSTIQFLVLISLAGGVLTLGVLAWHRAKRREGRPEIPYGVAIAFGGLAILTQRFLNQFA